ncbi:NmrA family NAD(P)-binding protein [Chelatococcus sp. SYSU_G07232]|uniref:NmrA family NAD(P)-binding protein n=1 Tax=Chelatococcus albus TaxID=3047466 RepID=A0ABT7AHI3_9HYPH|nr:NmrA family NAD(P)-binding protein [Chelatococcus sp. SYSU_G07232]MDJ1158545.1 NmrA family NAD(P)-binding protein [Chelatococcus sp. SYSU_G07232]
MNERPILVTGATGGRGSTGAHVVSLLRARQVPVRALVRHRDGRSILLEALGAEVVEGDLLRPTSLAEAFEGVRASYFCYPMADGLADAAVNVAAAARRAGVQAVVNLSMIPAAEGSPSPIAHDHWRAERIFDDAGISTVHLRAGLFYENLLHTSAVTIAEEDCIRLPFGHGHTKMAMVSARDVAAVAAAVLTDPAPHLSRTILVTGPEALSIRDVAERFGRSLGREVTYEDMPLESWREALMQSEGPNMRLVTHLLVLAKALQQGISFGQTTDAVRSIAGAEALSFEGYVRSHARSFRPLTTVVA